MLISGIVVMYESKLETEQDRKKEKEKNIRGRK